MLPPVAAAGEALPADEAGVFVAGGELLAQAFSKTLLAIVAELYIKNLRRLNCLLIFFYDFPLNQSASYLLEGFQV